MNVKDLKSQKRNHCGMIKKALALCAVMLLSWTSGYSYEMEPFHESNIITECNGGGVLRSISSSVASYKAYSTIAARYRGHVTLIQTWATWCGPCRRAINEMSSIKPSLVSRGVKFVCVTGETSNRYDFNSMYPNIQGDHYYLTSSQLQGFMQTLGQNAYPSFVLLNKRGQIVWESRGFPGNAEVAAQIRRYL